MSLSEVIKGINAAGSSIGKVSEEGRREALTACDRLRTSREPRRTSWQAGSHFRCVQLSLFLTNLSLIPSYMSGSHSVCRP